MFKNSRKMAKVEVRPSYPDWRACATYPATIISGVISISSSGAPAPADSAEASALLKWYVNRIWKKPPVHSPRGSLSNGGVGKANPRRAITLARRWHGRDGERAPEAAPLNFSSRFVLEGSTFGTNNWPARAIILPILNVRCWQMRTFHIEPFR
jgi:hypothetical protein